VASMAHHRAVLRLVAAALAMPAVVGVARADDMKTCIDASGDVALAACTRAIQSGRLSKKDLAGAFTNRGVKWRAKDDVERAIDDHTEAIRIDPNNYYAYYNRGNAYLGQGDLDRAIADYGIAARLNRNDPDIFKNRAIAYERKGDSARANADRATEKALRH